MFVEIGQLMPSTPRSNGSRYSRKVILQILDEYYRSGSLQEIVQRFGITKSTLMAWLRKYGGEKYATSKRSPIPLVKKGQAIRAIKENRMSYEEAAIFCKVSKLTIKKWLKASKAENELDSFDEKQMADSPQTSADKQLAAAQLKIKALETLIDIAEEKFKIAIRKKPGAKQ